MVLIALPVLPGMVFLAAVAQIILLPAQRQGQFPTWYSLGKTQAASRQNRLDPVPVLATTSGIIPITNKSTFITGRRSLEGRGRRSDGMRLDYLGYRRGAGCLTLLRLICLFAWLDFAVPYCIRHRDNSLRYNFAGN